LNLRLFRTTIITLLSCLIFTFGFGCPGITMSVSAAEAESDEMVTGNAAAESAIAQTSTDTEGLADNQAALEEYLVQLEQLIEQQKQALSEEQKTTKRSELAQQTRSKTWSGAVLNKTAGVVKGPNGKETYYNLNMSKIVDNLKKAGYDSEYWVRNDGVKMFGDYIMVAANLSKYPRGTVVETSLGTGIVCDTGDFVKGSGITFDIATAW
jgi:hypothetical protein